MTENMRKFGSYAFDAGHRVLTRNGTLVALGQKSLALLETLLAAEGKSVSKDDLLQAVWGTTVIEESNLTVQIAALRKALGSKRDGREWIATVQRFGYQFAGDDAPTPEARASISLAVLPFSNLSADPEQKYFADGLAEDLITSLSKVPGLTVIARHSSFAYRDKTADTREIAKTLGARFLVDGSVRRAGERVRINAHVTDAEKGGHIWTDKFDGELKDVFELQDEVVAKIVKALSTNLPLPKTARQHTPSIEAYDLFVQGRLFTQSTPEGNRAARPLLERACALDPDFAEAHGWLAQNLVFEWLYCYGDDERLRAHTLAEKAVSLDPDNADAQIALAYMYIFSSKDLGKSEEHIRLALQANPNHADSWLTYSDWHVFSGDADQAMKYMDKAFQLNPLPHAIYYWSKSLALYLGKRYEELAEITKSDIPLSVGLMRNSAAAFAQLGRMDEAEIWRKRFMERVPQFTISSWIENLPFRRQRDVDHFIEGYTKAGFPK